MDKPSGSTFLVFIGRGELILCFGGGGDGLSTTGSAVAAAAEAYFRVH